MKCESSPFSRVRVTALFSTITLFMLASAICAHAQDISVTVDGDPVQFRDIGPQQISGRTLVPVRGVLEKLGADVSYNSQTQTVTASTPTIDIQLTIGSRSATVNSGAVTLDVPAQIINDHTFVPLRFLGEALGAEIRWDSTTRTVIIITRRGDHRRDDRDQSRRERTPPAPAVPDPVINSFTQTSGKWLRAGQPLDVTMDGTPGGQASFRIPGIADDVPMREINPGHYVGSWKVPLDKRMRLNSAAVIGSLEIGAKMAPLIQAGQTVSVDTVPPEIRDMAPEEQTNTNDPRPNISAAYDDEGSGIALDSVKMIVNGQDVTSRATVTRDFISYRPDSSLQAGPQQVEIRVRDQAGNRSESHWGFVERQRAESGIKSVSDNVDHAFQPGDTIRAEMVASPGGMAWFSTGSIQKVPMAEAQPGHYVAEYTIRRGDDTADKPIAFHLLSADGQRFEQASNHVVRIATGKPDPPVVTSPGPNEIPGNPLVVLGTARRNSRVRVRIEFRNRVLGLIALQGTAADVSVKVDRDGNWQTEPINLGRVLTNKGTDFTITVTAINAAGEVSEPTTTRFRMQ